ncbi:MAG: hypothetical protein M1294_04615 [Firmicutes bacterium]|uniref:Uncharacterized protein n=1 Tax=Sulfobacillus benefaciens TaxID=453960 RepID=A0A2T2WQV9_9FIRM|nr:hypothetical protein [Bacillota bacterium]MCL5013392.1 hypothetical protein [Bacillota bacterium]PSR24622.1 MAG: hypothetical protein C7B43_18560 [Sulfobacillus benefaciens]HBQ94737.1 hypothetical protein [Sulfobacillus sp.]
MTKKLFILFSPFVIATIGMLVAAQSARFGNHGTISLPGPSYEGRLVVPAAVACIEILAAFFISHYAQPIQRWQAIIVLSIFIVWIIQIMFLPTVLLSSGAPAYLWLTRHLEASTSYWIPGMWAGTFLWIAGHKKSQPTHQMKE